jgi:DNA-binding SARP family transcriptional activator
MLDLLERLARGMPESLEEVLETALSTGRLALDQLADVIVESGRVVPLQSETIARAIALRPSRWLPALRRQLHRGAPDGLSAASLLDRYGEFEDVSRLRAFAKAYRKRGASPKLGLQVAHRTSPHLVVRDLGRCQFQIGDRVVLLSGIRRKAAALLLYLATQPGQVAHKEQVLDALWPDADPDSALNSLNQSLYFLRREIDPWYEDELSTDYVGFGGDLLWLDAELVSLASSEFLRAAAQIRSGTDMSSAIDLVRAYPGHFAPEFEYEEWAMDWRSKVHSVLLELAHSAIESLTKGNNVDGARELAVALLDIDPGASEIERRLISLLWSTGASSAARAQYEHLVRMEARDGLESESFAMIVGRG